MVMTEGKIIKMFMVMVFVMVVLVEILMMIDDNCMMVGVDNYCIPLHQLRRKGQETPKKKTRSSKGECSTGDQTIILGLHIFLDNRSSRTIHQKL